VAPGSRQKSARPTTVAGHGSNGADLERSVTEPGPGLSDEEVPAKGTRERILDIALDLFIDKGFDKTSLREIAEQLGFSKAALYYHFASKDDILLALHLRLHEVLRDTISRLGSEATTMVSWRAVLDRVIDQMLANRRLFVLHERNRAAFEQLHMEGHDAEHDDFEDQFRRVLADEAVPLRDRVRLACSLGAVMSGLFLAGKLFDETPSTTLGALLRDAVNDLLGPEKSTSRPHDRGKRPMTKGRE
jgi:AcrR family transcriptional regulator